MKVCRICKVEKPLDDFGNLSNSKDGHDSRCKECSLLRSREWRTANNELSRSNASRYRKENRERLTKRDRASKYGLTVEEMDELISNAHGCCESCGQPAVGKNLHIDHDHTTGRV